MKEQTESSVGIIGCGWLGTALAKSLQAQGVQVTATRSNAVNAAQLTSQGIHTYELLLPAKQEVLNNHAIFNAQCLIIAITPQFRHGRNDYAEKVTALVEAAQRNTQVKKIILLSSTAVYNGLSGSVTEEAKLDFSAEKVSVLNQAEQAVLAFTDQANKTGNVLRLSGLVGPNRHPGKFLLHGRMLKSPEAKVNLIHQDDAVGLIIAIIKKQDNAQNNRQNGDVSAGVFNGASDTHVSKKVYYHAAAKALGHPAPKFADTTAEVNPRIVCAEKAKHELDYQFCQADLLSWLSQESH